VVPSHWSTQRGVQVFIIWWGCRLNLCGYTRISTQRATVKIWRTFGVMLTALLAATSWRVVLRMWRVTSNMLNKQSWIADKG